jgi:hypothetical protein
MPYFPYWSIGLQLLVIRTAFMWSWCTWGAFPGRLAGPLIILWRLRCPMTSQFQMYVCIRVGHKAGPCIVTFNDLLCFPFRLALY